MVVGEGSHKLTRKQTYKANNKWKKKQNLGVDDNSAEKNVLAIKFVFMLGVKVCFVCIVYFLLCNRRGMYKMKRFVKIHTGMWALFICTLFAEAMTECLLELYILEAWLGFFLWLYVCLKKKYFRAIFVIRFDLNSNLSSKRS